MNAAIANPSDRLERLRERIAQAAERSGRHAADVTLIGVAKTASADQVRTALAAGLTDVGENRVQEAEQKIAAIGHGARWHLVGHLQSNKASRAAALFDRMHSIDDDALARRVGRLGAASGKALAALVQVNLTGAPGQHGVTAAALEPLLERTRSIEGLVVDGLMTIGPVETIARGEGRARRCFADLRALRDAMERRLGVALPQLSMGMTADFEAAIEEGSTMVRIGTALFGARE